LEVRTDAKKEYGSVHTASNNLVAGPHRVNTVRTSACQLVRHGGMYRTHVKLIESIEAKPKSATEPTLDVAYEVVQRLLANKEKVSVYEWPTYTRPQRGYRWQDEDDEDDFNDDDFEEIY
jgi:hypothetical protein